MLPTSPWRRTDSVLPVDTRTGTVRRVPSPPVPDGRLKVDTGGLTPTLHWADESRLAAIGFPRPDDANLTLQVVRQGQLVTADEGFVKATGTLQNADVH